mmetsp:Transcript_11651/g.33681  ORF Transcript_11651/g.33681 Transcript_11651/m.33681 type:complete len:425 (+) Transcript_11651:52-1326(+)
MPRVWASRVEHLVRAQCAASPRTPRGLWPEQAAGAARASLLRPAGREWQRLRQGEEGCEAAHIGRGSGAEDAHPAGGGRRRGGEDAAGDDVGRDAGHGSDRVDDAPHLSGGRRVAARQVEDVCRVACVRPGGGGDGGGEQRRRAAGRRAPAEEEEAAARHQHCHRLHALARVQQLEPAAREQHLVRHPPADVVRHDGDGVRRAEEGRAVCECRAERGEVLWQPGEEEVRAPVVCEMRRAHGEEGGVREEGGAGAARRRGAAARAPRPVNSRDEAQLLPRRAFSGGGAWRGGRGEGGEDEAPDKAEPSPEQEDGGPPPLRQRRAGEGADGPHKLAAEDEGEGARPALRRDPRSEERVAARDLDALGEADDDARREGSVDGLACGPRRENCCRRPDYCTDQQHSLGSKASGGEAGRDLREDISAEE